VIDAVHSRHAVGDEQDGMRAIRDALAEGGNVNKRGKCRWKPLMHAALECRADEIKLLFDKGADPSLRASAVDAAGFTRERARPAPACCRLLHFTPQSPIDARTADDENCIAYDWLP